MVFNIDAPSRRGHVAFIDPSTRAWTFGDVADQIIRRQKQLGRKKRLIFIFCRQIIDHVLWYLAALDGGHVAALLDGGMTPVNKTEFIRRYIPDTVIDVSPPINGMFRSGGDGVWMREKDSLVPPHSDLALLLATSGTTGHPRLVRLSRRNIEANAAAISKVLGIETEDRAVGNLPIYYSYGLSVLNTHLLCGAQYIVIKHGLLSKQFWKEVRTHEATSLAGVPHSYRVLRTLRMETLNVPTLRWLTQAGGKMRTSDVEHFNNLMIAREGGLFVMYGQTEATARISVLKPFEVSYKLGSVGRPIPGGSVSLRRVSGATGELVYQGPNVMLGYANFREDLTKGDELRGTLNTGDLASIDEDGYIYIKGRADRDAKVCGLRVNLDHVENILNHCGHVAVIEHEDVIRIFVESHTTVQHEKYQRLLAQATNVPCDLVKVYQIDRLPLTHNGKIDYSQLSIIMTKAVARNSYGQ
jgi:acyl-coenzyme A synthetase/AMP-(fatty) acid ligase